MGRAFTPWPDRMGLSRTGCFPTVCCKGRRDTFVLHARAGALHRRAMHTPACGGPCGRHLWPWSRQDGSSMLTQLLGTPQQLTVLAAVVPYWLDHVGSSEVHTVCSKSQANPPRDLSEVLTC